MARSTIKITVTGDASDAQRALKATGDAAEDMGRRTSTVGDIVKGVLTADAIRSGARELGGFLRDSIQAAQDDEATQRQLAETLRNVTGANDEQIASVEKYITKTEFATGVLDDKLRPALQNVLRASHDTATAQDLLRLSMDISASTGRDLETVSIAIAKAYDGNISGLSRLGISMKDANGDALSWDEAQKQLNETFGGAAQAAADTTAGKMAILSVRYQEFKENIGNVVLPILLRLTDFITNTLVPGIQRLSQIVQDNKEYFLAAAIGITAVLVPAFVAWAVSAGAAAAATLIAAAPVIALAAQIGLLALGIIELVKHWDDLTAALERFWHWMNDNIIPVVETVGRVVLGLATGGLSELWIRFGDAGEMVNWFRGVLDDVHAAFDGVASAVAWLWTKLGELLDQVNRVAGPLRAIGGAVSTVGGAIGGAISHIPGFASGGIVTGPTIAMVGEAGPEAIIPLDRLGSSSGGGGTVININAGLIATPAQVGQQIHQALIEQRRRVGSGLGLG